MAKQSTAQASITLVRTDGLELDATIEVRGSDAQLGDVLAQVARLLRGPAKVVPANQQQRLVEVV